MRLWLVVIVTAVGCYLLKLLGMAAPRGLLDRPLVRRFAELAPVALLAALVATQVVGAGQAIELDVARTAGIGAAVLTLVFRAPFWVVLLAAAVVTAGLRHVGVA